MEFYNEMYKKMQVMKILPRNAISWKNLEKKNYEKKKTQNSNKKMKK
jgi:hypothetical protein